MTAGWHPAKTEDERWQRRQATYRKYRAKPEVKARKAAWEKLYRHRPNVESRRRQMMKIRRIARAEGISTRTVLEAMGGVWRKA